MLPCAVNPLIPYAMSSTITNPSARSGALGISTSSALYNIKRIGDDGEPCRIPASIFMLADVVPLKRSCVVRSVRKLSTSLTICEQRCTSVGSRPGLPSDRHRTDEYTSSGEPDRFYGRLSFNHQIEPEPMSFAVGSTKI